MAGNKDKIQIDTEDVAQFFFPQSTKEKVPLLHREGNGTWNHTSAHAGPAPSQCITQLHRGLRKHHAWDFCENYMTDDFTKYHQLKIITTSYE